MLGNLLFKLSITKISYYLMIIGIPCFQYPLEMTIFRYASTVLIPIQSSGDPIIKIIETKCLSDNMSIKKHINDIALMVQH